MVNRKMADERACPLAGVVLALTGIFDAGPAQEIGYFAVEVLYVLQFDNLGSNNLKCRLIVINI